MKMINKDALLAWAKETYLCENASATRKVCYKQLLEHLSTFEVKEVDLEKAIDDYIYTHDGRKRLALEPDWKYCNLTLKGGNEIIKFAKYFFELGLKTQKGENAHDTRRRKATAQRST